MGKTVFWGLRQFAFSQSNLLAIAQAIDAIDGSINPIDEKFSPEKCRKDDWRKALDR